MDGYGLASVIIGSFGTALLVAYVIATVKIAQRAGGQLQTLREEFTARTRPYLGFENLEKVEDTKTWKYTLRNFGWSPACNVVMIQGTGKTPEGRIKYGEAAKIVIFPGQAKDYDLGLETYESQFGDTVKYLFFEITYSSGFGKHWTWHQLGWNEQDRKWLLDLTEVGDGNPPPRWPDKQMPSSCQGSSGPVTVTPSTPPPQ